MKVFHICMLKMLLACCFIRAVLIIPTALYMQYQHASPHSFLFKAKALKMPKQLYDIQSKHHGKDDHRNKKEAGFLSVNQKQPLHHSVRSNQTPLTKTTILARRTAEMLVLRCLYLLVCDLLVLTCRVASELIELLSKLFFVSHSQPRVCCV